MALEVPWGPFTQEDVADFRSRLHESLGVLAEMLARPSFGAGEMTIGAELEVSIVDSEGRALGCNEAVISTMDEPRVTVELERFNLEWNLPWWPLAGRSFGRLQRELEAALSALREGAAAHGGRIVAVGILPTLTTADLDLGLDHRRLPLPGARRGAGRAPTRAGSHLDPRGGPSALGDRARLV